MTNREDLNRAKDTGLAFTLILMLISYWTHRIDIILPAICLLVLSLTLPRLLTPAARIWFGLTGLLENVFSRIFLTVIFFTLVLTVGIVRRMLRFDSMKTRLWKNGKGSVFMNRDHLFTASDLIKPF